MINNIEISELNLKNTEQVNKAACRNCEELVTITYQPQNITIFVSSNWI